MTSWPWPWTKRSYLGLTCVGVWKIRLDASPGVVKYKDPFPDVLICLTCVANIKWVILSSLNIYINRDNSFLLVSDFGLTQLRKRIRNRTQRSRFLPDHYFGLSIKFSVILVSNLVGPVFSPKRPRVKSPPSKVVKGVSNECVSFHMLRSSLGCLMTYDEHLTDHRNFTITELTGSFLGHACRS